VRAENTGNSAVSGSGGLITVIADPLTISIAKVSGDAVGLVAGVDQLLRVRVTDNFANPIAGDSVRFIVRSGGGNISGSDSVDVATDAAGNTEATLTTGLTPGTNIVTALRIDDRTDSVQFSVTTDPGGIAELRIQTLRGADQSVFGDSVITTDSTLVLFAAGYDISGNYLGEIVSDWTVTGSIGIFTTTNPNDSIIFDPTTVGSGTIRAADSSNALINDQSGLITVNPGVVVSITIRNAPDGGGSLVGTDTIMVGNSLTFYAAGYDADNNYVSDSPVNWDSTGTLSGLIPPINNIDNVVLNPDTPGEGVVFTTNGSGWTNDSTGTIVVQSGVATRIAIRTQPNNGGVELDTLSRAAGDSITLFAAFYDYLGNYLGDQPVTWSVQGDSIGYFATSTATDSNTFYFTTVNTANFIITSGSLSDNSGLIRVAAGQADSLLVTSVQQQTGQANSLVLVDPEVAVLDPFGNRVPNTLVEWSTPTDGSLTPPSVLSDEQGLASATWRLKTSLGADTAYAIVANIDTVLFEANVVSATADSILALTTNDTGTVAQQVTDFIVRVEDISQNPVPGVVVSFVVDSLPSGASGHSLSSSSGITDSTGIASTILTLGDKIGTYRVRAYNGLLKGSPVTFRALAVADSADSVIVYAGNLQSGTVADTLTSPLQARVVDQYQNPVSGISVIWTPTADGDTIITSDISDVNGLVEAQWILRTTAGPDTLTASAAGLGSAVFTATANNDVASEVIAYLGNNTTTFAGSNRTIQAQALDQYGNPAPLTTVNFIPVSRVSSSTVVTNALGISETVYTTPQNDDSSFVQAYITGLADTALYKIYAVRYVSNSLDPKVSAPGSNEDFSAFYSNPGIDTVFFDTTNTIFTFTDGTYTASSNLSSPLFLAPQTDSTELFFNNTDIDADFTTGNFTPEVDFLGTSGGQNVSGMLNMDPGELSLAPLEILSITITDPASKTAVQGDSLRRIEMVVRNNSLSLINNIVPDLTFAPPLASSPIKDPANPDSIAGNSQVTLILAADIPSDALLGTYTIDGTVNGNLAVNGNPVFDTGANFTDSFDIISGASVTFVGYTPQTVSAAQNVAFAVTVSNTGVSNVVLDQTQTTFEFGGQEFNLDGNQIISPDTSSTLRFVTEAVGLVSGNYLGTLTLVGTENGVPYSDTLNTGISDSLTVQDPALLEIVSIINPTSVLQGQENILDTLIIRNTGEATARVTSATLNFQNGNNFYSQIVNSPLFPVDLAGGQTDTVEISVNVLNSAPLAIDSLAGNVEGIDVNSQVSLDTISSYLSSWQVFGSGGISLLSVSTTFDTVSTGQDSILVTTRVENSGTNSVTIDSLRLTMNRGLYIDSTLNLTPGSVLASGSRGEFDFYVSVDSNSATGIATINAAVFGTDTVTGPVSDLSADTTASWLIQRRVTIAIASATPTAASIGQVITPSIDLSNSGTAELRVDTSQTILQSSAFSSDLKLSAPLTIAGGGSYTLDFNAGAADGPSAMHPYTLRLVGTENGSLFDNTYILNDSLTLTAPAQLVIDSLVASTDTVSQGMDTLVTVYVSNPGETDLVLDSLINTPYGVPTSVTPALPETITGGGSASYDLVVDIPAAATTGLIALDAIGLGRDFNSNQALFDSSATAGDSWTVLSSPNVVIDSIYSDSIVVPGQTDILVTVGISNTGETAVEINTLEILEQIGLYTHRGPDLPVTLSGSSSINLVDTVDVASNSATGIDSLRARISYRNTISGESSVLTSTAAWGWSIQSSQLVILSVSADQSEISVGQDSVGVAVRISNQGSGDATIDSLTLEFASGGTNYIVSGPTPGLSLLIPQQGDTTFRFNVDIDPAAIAGVDTIDARLVGTEGTEPIIVDGSVNPDVWTVQERPLVEIEEVSITPTTASTGQTGLSGRMIITNQPATYRSTARIDSVDYNFLLGIDNVDTNFVITQITPPVFPINLVSGASQAVDFTIDINPNALDTTYIADGSLSYADINDNSNFVVSSATENDTLTIQTTTTLNILSFVITPDTVSQGQGNITAIVEYENEGSAEAQITGAQLAYNPTADFVTALVNEELPITVSGNTIDTLVFNITAAQTLTDTIFTVDARLSGLDINSGISIGDTVQSTLVSQSPADITYIAGTIDPAVFEPDTIIAFTLDVQNIGIAYVDLDSMQTRLRILGTTYDNILLSGASPVRINSGSIVSLLFRERFLDIDSISPGDYAVQVDLIGTSTGAAFSQTIDAGQLTIGEGVVFFTGGNVTPDIVLLGQGPIIVDMFVGNNGVPLPIDSSGTAIYLRQSGLDIIPQPVITRTDSLDTLALIQDNLLTFQFDVPADYPLGIIEVWGEISLDDGALVKESIAPIATFEVFSGAYLEYIPGTLSDTQVVPRQDISFNITVEDTGTSGLTLIPGLSWLEIDDPSVPRANLSANYIIPPGDTSQISFNQITIPDTITTGTSYSFMARLTGVQVNGDTLIDTLTLEPIEVLKPAEVIVAGINIVPTLVRQNQSGVVVEYTLRNDGSSPAFIRNLLPHFTRSMDSKNVSANWVLSSITPELQDTLGVGNSRLLSAEYVLSALADTGIIIPYPEIRFNDVLTEDFVDTSITLIAFDSVRVITPAALRIDRLVLTDSLAPNRPRVNENENFILNMAVSNLGADSAKSVYITLLVDGTSAPAGQYFIPSIAPYDSAFIDMTRSITTARTEPYRFTTRIDSAFDATTGENISIAQPIDNREDIFVDTQVALNIISRIARPGGARDSVVSVGQQFEIDATVTNDGTAPYDPGRLRLDPGERYTLLSSADSTYNETNSVITWHLQANGVTPSGFDTIFISLIDTSADRNTGRVAGLNSFTDYILVKSDSAANIAINPRIEGPPGAQDGILSTGQMFTLTADISFSSSMKDSDRTAQLLIPGGYSVEDSTFKPLPDNVSNASISWNVFARNNVVDKLDSIRVRVGGVDANSGEAVQGTSVYITVRTIMRAELTLDAFITSPAGATDGRVSVGQNFDLSAFIENRGMAGVMPEDTGQVSIELPANLTLFSGAVTQPYVFGQPVIWTVNVLSEVNPSEIIVKIDSTPRDENSEEPASTVTDSVVVMIIVDPQGTIVLREVTPDDNLVSSGQTFIVSTAYELSSNVTNAKARISSLPNGFSASPREQGVISDSTLNWVIVAVEDVEFPRTETIEFSSNGFDENSGEEIEGPHTLISLTVQPRAEVVLSAEKLSPASLITKNTVSRGQQFEFSTTVYKDSAGVAGMADLTGNTTITAVFDSTQFTLDGESTRSYSPWNSPISWVFTAPDSVINASNISFSITSAPNDVNTGSAAFVAGDNGTRSFAVSVTQENLLIQNITPMIYDSLEIANNNFTEGSQNVPLMAFTAGYSGSTSETDLIKMDGITLRFLEPLTDQTMNPNRIVNMIESITISNMQWFMDSVATEFAKPAQKFITYMVPDTMNNPVEIRWDPPNEFLANSTDTVIVMVTFKSGVSNQSFRMVLENVRAYDVEPDLTLAAVDIDSNPIDESSLFTTNRISIVPENPEEAFITYPNPFGKNQEYANFRFILESGGDVEIRIFTLVGELVWTKIIQGESANIHDGAWDAKYRWDGRNDRGYQVLNGVYLCVIRLKENNGETKTYTKKIAYIK
jgi:hypothetical protein